MFTLRTSHFADERPPSRSASQSRSRPLTWRRHRMPCMPQGHSKLHCTRSLRPDSSALLSVESIGKHQMETVEVEISTKASRQETRPASCPDGSTFSTDPALKPYQPTHKVNMPQSKSPSKILKIERLSKTFIDFHQLSLFILFEFSLNSL